MGIKKIRNKRKRTIVQLSIVLLILLIVCFVIIFLKKQTNKEQVDNTKNKPIQEQELQEQESQEKNKQEKNKEDEIWTIKTKYPCELHFPKMYSDKIEVKYVEDEGYKVEFYGLVKNKHEKHLFDVCFNSDYGTLIGYIETDKDIVNISIDVMEIEFSDDFKQEEINEIYTLQEQMNFIIENLTNNNNYVSY